MTMADDTYVRQHLIRVEARDQKRMASLALGTGPEGPDDTMGHRVLTAWRYRTRVRRDRADRLRSVLIRSVLMALVLLWWALALALVVG